MSDKRWFPGGCMAKVKFRKPDQWDRTLKKEHFATWEEAQAFMLTSAEKALEIAKKQLRSAERHLARVKAMEPPAQKLGTESALEEAK